MRLIPFLFAAGLLAQDPTSISRTASGSITAADTACSAISCVWIVTPFNVATASIQLSGTFAATVQFETSVGGTTYAAITSSNGAVSSATAAGVYSFNLNGARFLRARASAYTSGAVTVSISAATSTGAAWFDDGANVSLPAGRTVTIGTSVLPNEADVRAYGAKCDGTTDDSAALQTALSAVIAAKGKLRTPTGTCTFGTSLVADGGYFILEGNGNFGSVWKYTGNGTALTVKNSTGNGVAYRVYLRDFRLISTGSAFIGIYLDNVEESGLENIAVGDNGPGFSTAAVYSRALAISHITGCVFANSGIGFHLDASTVSNSNNTSVSFWHNNFWQLATAGIKIGYCAQCVVSTNWLENVKYGLLIDNTTPAGEAVVSDLLVQGNNWTNNTVANSGYDAARFLRISSTTAANAITVKAKLDSNITNNVATNNQYCAEVVLTGNVSASGHSATLTVSDNKFWGCATAALNADTSDTTAWLERNDSRATWFGSTVPVSAGSGGYVVLTQGAFGTFMLAGPMSVGSTNLTHLIYIGAPVTITSGFGTSPSIVGKDSAGRVTVGTGGTAATGVIAFWASWTVAPACVANDETTNLPVRATATTTALTLSSASAWAAGDKLTWSCGGF